MRIFSDDHSKKPILPPLTIQGSRPVDPAITTRSRPRKGSGQVDEHERRKMIYFTSDTHFFHRNIIQYCKRPFSTVEEMNDCLIRNWNSVVDSTDSVYFLGDFSFGDPAQTEDILTQLRGHKHLIRGNHDRHGRHSPKKSPFPWEIHFNTINDYLRLKTEGYKFVLCHFPFSSWERGYINLHGHTHGYYSGYFGQHDVGVDVNEYRPISAQEAFDKATKKEKTSPYL